MKGLVGNKLGMMCIFNKIGDSIPVTVLKVHNNIITQIKSLDNDGYVAVQVTTGDSQSSKKINKPMMGHFNKSGVLFGLGLWEFRCSEIQNMYIGQILDLRLFLGLKKVDVTSTTKGKGFSGTIKRWNFKSQDATHGNSLSHRSPGSIGQNQTPGRVFKGKKMSGHLGNSQVTIQNLSIVKIDLSLNVLLLKGSIPGYIGCKVLIRESIKKQL